MLFFRDIHVLQSLPLEILLHEAPIFSHMRKVSEKVIIQIETEMFHKGGIVWNLWLVT